MKDLKSLILSAPKNVTARELFTDYYEMTQTRLNYRQYGFRSEDEFLGAYPQYFYAASVYKGQILYGGFCVNLFFNFLGISNNPKTNTIAKLVNGQKNAHKGSNMIQYHNASSVYFRTILFCFKFTFLDYFDFITLFF